MKVAFCARGLNIPSGGVHQYIKSIIPALVRQRGNDEICVLYNNEKFLGLASECSEIVINGNNRIFWDFFRVPKILRELKIDATIFPKNVVPFFLNCRSYVVIHDLAYFEKQLNAYPFLDTLYMRTLLPQSVRRAEAVFAVSENTKREIIRFTKCNPEKITVTYEAADKMYSPINDDSVLKKIKRKYNLPDDFILYVGSLSPRKNVNGLLEAFFEICSKIPHDLVLTGSKSWKDSSVFQTIKKLNLSNRVKLLGFVEHEDMPVLYNLAGVYVYPSLYEGFGLPVLEAMQCGCPVVASNTTSMPEVAGYAAVLVDTLDFKILADAIYQVINDINLRKKLIGLGFQQAEKFSWDRCADKMLKVIRQL